MVDASGTNTNLNTPVREGTEIDIGDYGFSSDGEGDIFYSPHKYERVFSAEAERKRQIIIQEAMNN